MRFSEFARRPGALARGLLVPLGAVVLAGCSLATSQEREAEVTASDWTARPCSMTPAGFVPIGVRVDVVNTGPRLIEYVQTDFEVDVEVTGLSDEDVARLREDLVCVPFQDGVCTLETSADWLVLLDPEEATYRDVRYGGNSTLTRLVERTPGARFGAVRDVRLLAYRFEREDLSG